MKPRLLDLFCGAGGAAMGYHRAGFEVVGVDIVDQPRYAGDEFIQGDALELADLAWGGGFAAIHASPPCQYFTQMRASWRAQGINDGYVDLLTPTLELLRTTGLPYVVENVIGARRAMRETLMLHGGMFGLAVHRPRVFETNFLVLVPKSPINKEPVGVYDSRPRGKTHHRTRLNGNGKGRSEMRIARTLEEGQEAMGIDWMTWLELKESIPPAYSELIGHQLMTYLRASGRLPADSSLARTSDTSAFPGHRTGSHQRTDGLGGNGSFVRSCPEESAPTSASSHQSGLVLDEPD